MKLKITLTHILILIAILILLYMIFYGGPSPGVVVVNRPIPVHVQPRIQHIPGPHFVNGGWGGRRRRGHIKRKFPKLPKLPKFPVPKIPKKKKKMPPLVPGGGGGSYPGDPYPGL